MRVGALLRPQKLRCRAPEAAGIRNLSRASTDTALPTAVTIESRSVPQPGPGEARATAAATFSESSSGVRLATAAVLTTHRLCNDVGLV
ncbi:hypothetical protein ACQY0O_004589 [Thecaphora frezii]